MTTTRSVLARTVRGAGWVIAWRLGVRVLGLISTLILVRLLVPSDFGLLALAASFSQTVDGMMTLGTEEAVIRQPSPDRNVYDTAWTLNVIRGLTVTAIVLLSAVPVADFFGDRRLVTVLMVIALPPLLDGLSNIGTVDFRRQMQFQKEFAIMVVPKFFGIVATLTAAFIHPSYTALLWGIATNQSLRSAMSYVMHPFRPRFSLRSWRGLIGYSIWTWLLSLAILLRNRSDTLLLGRLTNSTVGRGLLGRSGSRVAADQRTGGAVVPRVIRRIRRGESRGSLGHRNVFAADEFGGSRDPAGGPGTGAGRRAAGAPRVRPRMGRGGTGAAGVGTGGHHDGVRADQSASDERA